MTTTPRRRRTPAHAREEMLAADGVAARPLVTLHLPLDMRCAGEVMKAVARAYPSAVVGENGQIIGVERP